MSNENEEDDTATIVIDIEVLKKSSEERIVDMAQDISFDDSESQNSTKNKKKHKVILFDLGSHFFRNFYLKFPTQFSYLLPRNIKELNKILQKKEANVIVLYYPSSPKACEQMTEQLKRKFADITPIVIAKEETKLQVDNMIHLPLKTSELKRLIREILLRKK